METIRPSVKKFTEECTEIHIPRFIEALEGDKPGVAIVTVEQLYSKLVQILSEDSEEDLVHGKRKLGHARLPF